MPVVWCIRTIAPTLDTGWIQVLNGAQIFLNSPDTKEVQNIT